MCGDYWIPNRENIINIYERQMVEEALANNYNVIIDATNLNPKTQSKWKSIAQTFNAKLLYKEFIIPYKEAVKRDKNRNLQIGEDTIRMFYRKYYPEELQVDLDEL
jgi:predicted kinase